MDLPPPKKNAEWPQPGGTADNVMGNLMADGPLARVWSASAGKGTDGNSRLTAPPIVAGGAGCVFDAETHVLSFNAYTRKTICAKNITPPRPIVGSSLFKPGG